MLTTDEDGRKLRIRNRRYVDRRYIKLRQRLPYKQWVEAVKINIANGKTYQEQSRQ